MSETEIPRESIVDSAARLVELLLLLQPVVKEMHHQWAESSPDGCFASVDVLWFIVIGAALTDCMP